MTVWEVAIEKEQGGEYWINVYHVNLATQAEVQAAGFEIATIESQIHQTTVAFTKYRIRQASPLAGPGTVYPLGFQGLEAAAPSLPLFNVQRIDFSVTVGRPSRKYLKLPVQSAAQTNGRFTQAHLTGMNNSYSTPIRNVEGICASDGQAFTAVTANPVVGMRQLRRGSKKKMTPVLE